ncbi:hypothetical protein TorRG33x02_228950 [Trema orientale]|uniref:Uncharacterized protein n=1 Tax=Trema orientale TaxID=63057 RepID=A0A2P5E734_TREOI|nr:hypothetical protein TorRG33x02_228950 [Trema orientale]
MKMKMETEGVQSWTLASAVVVRLDDLCNAQGRIKGQKIPGMEWTGTALPQQHLQLRFYVLLANC